MKYAALSMLCAGLLAVGCGGSHSPTEPAPAPSAAPFISNLKVLPFTRLDASSGDLPLSFDFADLQGDVSEVVVTTAAGPARNPTQEIAGQTRGTYGLLQAVHLADPNVQTLAFTVQVNDAAGNASNVLHGEVAIPKP